MRFSKPFLFVLFATIALWACRKEAPAAKKPTMTVETVPAPAFPKGEQKVLDVAGFPSEALPCSQYFWGEGFERLGYISFVIEVQEAQDRKNITFLVLLYDKVRTEIVEGKKSPTVELKEPSQPGGVIVRLSQADYDHAKKCLPPPNLVFGKDTAAAAMGEQPLEDLSAVPIRPASDVRCGKYLILNGSKLACRINPPGQDHAVLLLFELDKYVIVSDESKKAPTAQVTMEDGAIKRIILRMSLEEYEKIRGCLPSREFILPPPAETRPSSPVA